MTGRTVTHVISSLADGGAEAVLFRLCTADDSCKHMVVSLTDDGKYGDLLRQHGVHVECLGLERGRMSLGAMLRLYRVLRASKPTVLQTWMYHADLIGGVVGRLAGVHNLLWGMHNSRLNVQTAKEATIWVCRLNAFLSRWVPRAIICCAKQSLDVHIGLGYCREKMFVIANGYDLDVFKPCEAFRSRVRRELSLDSTIPVLGLVARFDPDKDHRNLIQALGMLKDCQMDFRVVLVGSGMTEHNRDLISWIAAAGVEHLVRLIGPRNDIPAIMNAIDVNLLSSRNEAFPNVLAEAMGCGTPCVTTDVGDAALIVGSTGWVVPPRDPRALAESMASALAEHANGMAWKERRKEARERIERLYGVARMVADYHRVWFATESVHTQ